MELIEINKKDNSARFLYWNLKRFRFEPTCWAKDIRNLYGSKKDNNHFAIILYR